MKRWSDKLNLRCKSGCSKLVLLSLFKSRKVDKNWKNILGKNVDILGLSEESSVEENRLSVMDVKRLNVPERISSDLRFYPEVKTKIFTLLSRCWKTLLNYLKKYLYCEKSNTSLNKKVS
jgi:hypothetical protein